MTEGPEPGHPDEQLSQGGHPADKSATPGYGLPHGYAAAPPGYGAALPAYGAVAPAPYGGYGRPAAPKPGLIPLRPLTVGEILDGAFSAIRWNPKTILVSSAAVAAVSGVLLALARYFVQSTVLANSHIPASGGTLTPAQSADLTVTGVALLGISGSVTFFANTILTGLLSVAISQGVLGRKETLGGAWRATRSRAGTLIATVLLATVLLVSSWVLAISLSAGVAALVAATTNLAAVGVLIGLLGGGTATVFAVITLVRWALAIPVIMLEATRPLASLRRSWQLVRRSSWRVLGILLLIELITGIASAVISLPFGLAGGDGGFGSAPAHVSALGVTVAAIGGILASTVTAPLVAGVVVLLYTDLRMRREGMDITLRATAGWEAPGGQSAGSQNPGPW